MNIPRIVVGLGMLVVSAWAVPLLSDVIGLSPTLSFATFGSIVCFAAGILFHSGVSERPRW